MVSLLSNGAGLSVTERLEDYRDLAWRQPWLAGAFTAMPLSLAGIPLTIGFVAKFYIIVVGVDVSLWLPIIVLEIGSAIGRVYYLRIVETMYPPLDQTSVKALPPASAGTPHPRHPAEEPRVHGVVGRRAELVNTGAVP
ncbi:MAG: proton-conducting transporter membrane subunit [Burkholderiaceae bacterium]